MAWKYNPFTDALDNVGSGGGTSYIDGDVEYHSNLPVTVGSPAVNSAFLVRKGEGFYFLTRKPAGIWVRELNNGNLDDWKYAGTFSDLYRDANFRIINDTDTSKELAFSLSGITTGTTRTLTVPDANGTISFEGHAASHLAGGSDAVAYVTGAATLYDSDDLIAANSRISHAVTGGWTVHDGDGFRSAIGAAANPLTTAGDLFVGGTSGAPARLALGTASQQLRVNSGATSLEYFTPAAGGTKTYAVFTATDNQPTATAFATLDTRNSIAVLDFDDATDESAVFVGIIPEAASLGSGLIVSLRWMATTATSGDVRWSVAWEKSNTDLDSDSFDTATAATATTNGTSGIVTVTNITCTNIDSLAAGDLFRLRVQRIGGDAADTMNSSDAELIAVEVRSAA
jgi:hypothetical protein